MDVKPCYTEKLFGISNLFSGVIWTFCYFCENYQNFGLPISTQACSLKTSGYCFVYTTSH